MKETEKKVIGFKQNEDANKADEKKEETGMIETTENGEKPKKGLGKGAKLGIIAAVGLVLAFAAEGVESMFRKKNDDDDSDPIEVTGTVDDE